MNRIKAFARRGRAALLALAAIGALSASALALAPQASAGGQAKKITLASLAKQVATLRSQNVALRRSITALAKRTRVTGLARVAGIPGPQGAQGPPGAVGAVGAVGAAGTPGAPGTARAWATINGRTTPPTIRRGEHVASVIRFTPGVYCVLLDAGLDPRDVGALATPHLGGAFNRLFAAATPAGCNVLGQPGGLGVLVNTWDQTDALTDSDFEVLIP
jgi:hypothetical protein